MPHTLSFQTVQMSPRFGAEASLVHVLDAAARAGFLHVGLDLWSIDGYLATGATLDALQAAIDERSLRCTDVVVLGLTADRDGVLREARRLADLGRRFGAQVCVGAVNSDEGEVTWNGLVSLVRECTAILHDSGLRLAVEYLPYRSLQTVEETAELCAAVGWDRASVLADSWSTCVTGQLDALTALPADGIGLVQFSDARLPLGDDVIDASRNYRVLPGEGNMGLDAFVRVVLDAGFQGAVSTEVLSRVLRALPPADAARALYQATRSFWEEAGGAVGTV